jgi:hypothetical protein
MKPKPPAPVIAPFLPVQFLLSASCEGEHLSSQLGVAFAFWIDRAGEIGKSACREVDETASRPKYLRNANAKNGAAVAAKGALMVNLGRRNIFNGLLRVQ